MPNSEVHNGAKKQAPPASATDKAPPTIKTPDSELTYIAGNTAGDHSIKVGFGEPRGGSYANLDAKQLTFDPEHCAERAQARFVAAHEGAHIGETLSLKQLGKSVLEIRKYAGMIGFHALRNVIEDGAINDRFAIRYDALQSDVLASYPRVTPGEELGLLNLPEVQAMAQALGRPPLYAQALAGILCDWSELRHELGFGRSLEEYQKQPRLGPPCNNPALKRFFDSMLPEARRAMSMIPGPHEGGEASYKSSVARFAWCETVLYPKLAELVELDIKEIAEEVMKNPQLQQQLQQGQQGQQEQQNQQGQPSQQGQQNQQDQQGQQDSQGASQQGNPMTPSEAQRQAREMTAAVDDAIRKYFESLKEKTEAEAPSTSTVIGETTQGEREAEAAAEAAATSAKITGHFSKHLLESLSPYAKARREIAGLLKKAESQLADTFEPERNFKWKDNLPSGPKLNTVEAMRFDLTGEGHQTMWKRRIDPKYPDQDLVILFDRSDSMETDDKYIPASRAMIFARELFQGLHIPTACVGFADTAQTFIDFDDDMSDPEVQSKVMQNITPLKQGTHDADGVKYAAGLLRGRPAKHKTIIVLSDAESGQGTELKETVLALAAEGITVLHFGLGLGTKDEKKNYIHSWGDLSLTDESENGFLGVFCREMEQLAARALEDELGQETQEG